MPVDPLPILLPGVAAILFLAFVVRIVIVRRMTRSLWYILSAGVITAVIWWGVYFLSVCLMAMSARTPEQQYQVALAYWGRGSNNFPDYQEAAKWMERAAEAGHAGAQRQLAWFYIVPVGVQPDRAKAHYWMKKAAEQGDPAASKDLSYFEKMYPQ
jgi:TPR repeat protein